MSRRSDAVSLRQMLDHAREAIDLTHDMSRDQFAADRVIGLAVTRLVEIVGEAANRVSPDTRAKYPEIPWRDAIDTRNRVAHGYDTVDMRVLWTIVHHEFVALVSTLEVIVEAESER